MCLLVILRRTIHRVICVYWNLTQISDWSRLTVRRPPCFVYFIPASMQWRVQRERRKNDALWQIGGHCYSVNLPFLRGYHSHPHLCTDWTRFKEKDVWTCLNRNVFPLALSVRRSRCRNCYGINDWKVSWVCFLGFKNDLLTFHRDWRNVWDSAQVMLYWQLVDDHRKWKFRLSLQK